MTRLGIILGLAACSPVDVEMMVTPDAMVTMADAADSCAPSTFLGCADPSTARSCNDVGDGVVDADCGAPGCNAAAGRCNVCVPLSASCNGTALVPCDPDGLLQPEVTCPVACVDPGGGAARCAYLEPKYLPDVCDVPAVEPSFVVDSNASFDTSLAANCNGGVVATQSPAICVVRYGTFTVNALRTFQVSGSRVLAIVTDGPLEILGTLDVSSENFTSGPGGGTTSSGTGATVDLGGGGAGFAHVGADGGNGSTDGGANNGGAVLDPLTLPRLVGGPRATSSQISTLSGASGGGATLISCRGRVTVSGLIDAGGGGGAGGFDEMAGAGTVLHGGGGGGAGGYVVFQGLDVSITGETYANGGAGGGGAADENSGSKGGDGSRATNSGATAGAAAPGAGIGGIGGYRGNPPATGKHPAGAGSPGGGGGSMGYFQVYVPDGVTPDVTPSKTSPLFEPLLRVGIR